jgi:hypothetical protein
MTLFVEIIRLLAMVAVFAICMPVLLIARWALLGVSWVLLRADAIFGRK